MKKFLAVWLIGVITVSSTFSQVTKQFSGNYANGKATYSYYIDPATQDFVKHGVFKYTTSTGFTITGSFANGKRNGNWLFKTTANNTKTTRYILGEKVFVTVNGSEVISVNYKNGLYNGSFSLTKNYTTKVKNKYGGDEPLFNSKVNTIVKANFKDGKLVGSVYIKDDDFELKGQYSDDSYCAGTWTVTQPSKNIYETHQYKNSYLVVRNDRDENGRLSESSINLSQAYADFEPFMNQPKEVQFENDFDVNTLCNDNVGYTTYRVIKYIYNFYEEGNLTNDLEGDLSSLESADWGGCTNVIKDFRDVPSFYSTDEGKSLLEVKADGDVFKLIEELDDVKLENIKPSERMALTKLKDSLNAILPDLINKAQENFTEVNEQIKQIEDQTIAAYKSINNGESLYTNRIYPAGSVIKDGKSNFYVQTPRFVVPGTPSYSTSTTYFNAATPAVFYLANTINNSSEVKSLIDREKKRHYSPYFDYYTFFSNPSKSPISYTVDALASANKLITSEKVVFGSFKTLENDVVKNSKLKSWAGYSLALPALASNSVLGCNGCEGSWVSPNELNKKLDEYNAVLEQLRNIELGFRGLINQEGEMSAFLQSLTESFSTEKTVMLKSGLEIAMTSVENDFSNDLLTQPLGESLDFVSANISKMSAFWSNAIETNKTVYSSIDDYKKSRQLLDSIVSATNAMAEASGIKEYVSAAALFQKSLLEKLKVIENTESAATDLSTYQETLKSHSDQLNKESEPFVVLQSVCAKPLTKENKKAIKGATKDPAALLTVLQSL